MTAARDRPLLPCMSSPALRRLLSLVFGLALASGVSAQRATWRYFGMPCRGLYAELHLAQTLGGSQNSVGVSIYPQVPDNPGYFIVLSGTPISEGLRLPWRPFLLDCYLYVRPDVLLWGPTNRAISWPADPRLVNATFYWQGIIPQQSTVRGLLLHVTDACAVTILRVS